MSSDVLEGTKALCRSVLMCNSYGVAANKFAKEFEETTGQVLPIKKLGIRTAIDLPKVMPDVIRAERNATGQVIFYVVADQKTAHIAMMKSKEKKKSGKKNRRLGQRKIFFEGGTSRPAPVRSYGPALSRSSTSTYKPPVSRPTSTLPTRKPPPRFEPAPRYGQNNNSTTTNRGSIPRFQMQRQQLNSVNNALNRDNSVMNRDNNALNRDNSVMNRDNRVNNNNNNNTMNRDNRMNNIPQPPPKTTYKPQISNVPAGMLRGKIRNLMTEFVSGLYSGSVVMEYEKFFKETAPDNLLELVIQMEGTDVRIERPFGPKDNRFVLYSLSDEEPAASPSVQRPINNGVISHKPKYPYTYRYTHAPLPWLGIRLPCYVTMATNPEYFWIQVKSEHLEDLHKITDMIQTNCQNAPVETNGRFFVDELVCGLYTDGQWYRAIVLDVGKPGTSGRDLLDPALFLPNKPNPMFTWKDGWMVKLFFVDYGNIEWLSLKNVRRQKFPYPPGQAFRCTLGSITPTNEWSKNVCDTFRRVTEGSETLCMTVEAVKSPKAHYGFKSRLQEYCQKNKHEMPVYDRPLNSDNGWRTTCHVTLPNKSVKHYKGFYQNKKNDSEASAAQHVIRDWDIQLLSSKDMPNHWLEIHLEEMSNGEHFNKSLVESNQATPKTSIYDMVIPRQPPSEDVPMFNSEMGTNNVEEECEDSSSEYESEESFTSEATPPDTRIMEPEPLVLPKIGQMVYMKVTHVESPKNFCMMVKEKDNYKRLHKLEDEITSEVDKNHVVARDPKVGSVVAVYQGEIAYRVRVLKLHRSKEGKREAEVLMLDYGDTIDVGVEEMYQFDMSKYCDFPYQAISCCLCGMENIIDMTEISKYMRDHIEDVTCLARIKDIVNGDTLSVELYDGKEDGDMTNINEEIFARDIRTLRPSIPRDEYKTVLLTNVSREGILSVQIPGKGVDSLGHLMAELTQYYEERGALKARDYLPNPRIGQICCAAFTQDGVTSWYRALVQKKIDDDKVEVKYVDYGNTAEIANTKLREPTKAIPNISRLPYQAMSVRLADLPVNPESWTHTETDKLRGYVQNQTILAKLEEEGDNLPLVRLYIESAGEDEPKEINQLLTVDRNLFNTPINHTDITSNFEHLSLQNPVHLSLVDYITSASVIPKLKLKKQVEAIVSHVDHPGSWFFQMCSYYQDLKTLGEQMQQYYSNPLRYDHNFKQDEMCVAYCTRYRGWYRAKILAFSSDKSHVQCNMVDYGDVNTIPINMARPLVKQFANLPIQACRASLYGVLPNGGGLQWDQTSKSFFIDKVCEKTVWVRVMHLDKATSLLSMEIIDTHGEQDITISHLMLDSGLGSSNPAQPRISVE